MATVPSLSWVDWALLAVLVVSVFIGLWRGFVFEVLSLLGWLVAWFGAQWLAPVLAPYLPVAEPGSATHIAACYALGFFAILLAWALLARLVRVLVHATPLSLPDRVLGAGFGLLRGGVLLLAVSTAVALSPAAHSKTWQGSQGAQWLGIAMLGIKPLLPNELARHLPT